MSREHPLVSVYGVTEKNNFPLILFVGREANNVGTVGNEVGDYNFGKEGDTKEYKNRKNRCPFWNTAFKIVAQPKSLHRTRFRWFKQLVKDRMSSPIIFADISYLPIKNRKRDKKTGRKKAMENASKHIKNIFAKRKIMNRVKLVFLCGLDASIYQDAIEEFKRYCSKGDIKYYEIPFLQYPNVKKIKGRLRKLDCTNEIRYIRKQWEASS